MSNYIVNFLRGLFPRTGRVAGAAKCKDTEHHWRSIAPPYAKQCRTCGAVVFREDDSGAFPDGLEEYMAAMKTYRGPLTNRPPWVCDCGERMIVKTDCDKCGAPGMINADHPKTKQPVWFCKQCGHMEPPNQGLGPIWFCLKCQSWRKTI